MGKNVFAARGRASLAQRIRAARARTHKLSLDPTWQHWAITNLVRGASEREVFEALVEQGVQKRVAARQVAELARAPSMAVARWWDGRRAQLAARARVLTRLRATCAEVERFERLPAAEFFQRYYSTNTPVVLTRAIEDWPALSKWSPQYFEEHFADVEIEIVEGRQGDPECDRKYSQNKRTTTMGAYARRVRDAGKTNDFYFTARNRNVELEGLAELRNDVRPSPSLFDLERAAGAQSFWFGPMGSLTAVHHDPTNILFCQIYGRKRVTLAAPTDLGFLSLSDGFYSKAPPELDSVPQLAHSPSWQVDLEPGHALFIPALWWHQVEALSVSISFSLLHFKRQNRFEGYKP